MKESDKNPKETLQQKLTKRKYHKPNRLYNTIYYVIMYYFVGKKYKPHITVRDKISDCKGPCFLIWNHLSRLDHLYATAAAYPRPLSIVAGYNEFFRSHLHTVFDMMKILPKKNFTNDLPGIRAMNSIIRKGGCVCFSPEGTSSLFGYNQPIVPGTGKFIKHYRIPVYFMKLQGTYLTSTKTCLDERYGRTEAELSLLFTPELGPLGKRIWAYSFYLLMMAVYTLVNVPYGSLLGVMTSDDNEKNEFSSYRMVGAYAMGFITLLTFPYLQKMVGGTEAHQYAVLGASFGLLATLMTLACGLLTKERVKNIRPEKLSLQQYKNLLTNKPWLLMTAVAVCTNFFNGFRYAVAGYMFTYCLNGDITWGSLIINFTVFMAIGEVTCMIFGGVSPAFTKWIGSKRMAFVWSAVICCVTSVLYFFIPMDPDYLWLMILVSILTSVGAGLYSPLLWSMYADVSDYATERDGTSSTGLIFSSATMAQKFGGAVSGSLIAYLLGIAGLVSSTNELTGETIVTITDEESVKTMVWSMFSLFPAAIALVMGWLAYKFPLKK